MLSNLSRVGVRVLLTTPIKRSLKVSNRDLQALRGRSFRPKNDSETFSVSNITSKAGNSHLIAAGSAIGIGSLALYGLASGNSSSLSAMDKMSTWPDHVRQRIRTTYAYLAGSLGICAFTAVNLAKNPRFISMAMGSGWAFPIMMAVGSIGTGIACRSMQFPNDNSPFNAKHLMWGLYSLSLGAMMAPICLMGGPIITQASLYTGAIVGSLSLVGATAPSEKFLYMGGVLSIGLGVVFISSIGTIFASPISRIGMGLNAISIYGGLVVFSGLLLYDTQKVVYRAETHPTYAMVPFDPINNSISILLDTINIFTRIVYILSNGGGNRRK